MAQEEVKSEEIKLTREEVEILILESAVEAAKLSVKRLQEDLQRRTDEVVQMTRTLSEKRQAYLGRVGWVDNKGTSILPAELWGSDMVEVRLRDGSTMTSNASSFGWAKHDCRSDIMAWRKV